MFNPDPNDLLTLGQLARLVPARGGKRTAASTVWRWCRAGKGGVRLEHVRRPNGDYLSTRAALERFLEAVALAMERHEAEARYPPSAGWQAAKAYLEARGC